MEWQLVKLDKNKGLLRKLEDFSDPAALVKNAIDFWESFFFFLTPETTHKIPFTL